MSTTPTPITKDLRNDLKAIVSRELANLPATLESMEPDKRLEAILKLLPYLMPKVQPLSSTYDISATDWDL
jgi:hypothetical protein